MINYKECLMICLFTFLGIVSKAQEVMTPQTLWELGRVGAMGISKDGKEVIYSVRHYDLETNKSSTKMYAVPINASKKRGVKIDISIGESTKGNARAIKNSDQYLEDDKLSPNGKMKLYDKRIKLMNVNGSDLYPELELSNVQVYDDLMYRHWDTWADGSYNHVFVSDVDGQNELDIMENQMYHCPTVPFGGAEDYIWSPDGKQVLYVTKQKIGSDYAVSTNTDIYAFDLESKKTKNLTKGMMGYDVSPAFSKDGLLAWLSMPRDGYESDKNDIIVMEGDRKTNLTKHWDGTVFGFQWAKDGKNVYFTAPVDGTRQLFKVEYPGNARRLPLVKQITEGQWDVNGIVGEVGNDMIVTRTDMNHAKEIYKVDLKTGKMTQLTFVNSEIYNRTVLSRVEKRMIKTTDDKDMLTWVIYPPDFDPAKKYPTLLYCQGGPQGALSQFYSFRWNFQVMAAQGYIIVAPNRRGMPGHGIQWNEQISKDYGGQNMKDYLSAIDALAEEPYVDNDRLGAIGASYGGYSVFFLAGNHNKRFKTFISHDGIFNWRSMYGTTEELFFVNWDLGGAYWDTADDITQKAYNEFNPINYVNNWDTPILIYQGGKDYRVPIGQGLEAFQAAQLKGLKSRLVYLPEENHWVLSVQNGIVWQKEFFRWLKETL